MADVGNVNTKEIIHQRAKEVNIKPWTLGCQCFDCCKEFDKIIERTGKEDVEWAANEFEKNVWNKAIEAAANHAVQFMSEAVANEIRSLKK